MKNEAREQNHWYIVTLPPCKSSNYKTKTEIIAMLECHVRVLDLW